MTKKMIQAMNDLPIQNAISNHSVNHGESMCWIGESGSEYKTNTLTALVKRGLVQYRYDLPTPLFEIKTKNHNGLHFDKMNRLWI